MLLYTWTQIDIIISFDIIICFKKLKGCFEIGQPNDRRKVLENLRWKKDDAWDTEPEILFMHANDHRRWRIAQAIERMGFNLCFWV
jgi:hypothetical protein